MGSLLKLAVSSGTDMNILTAVCCLLITGVLTDLFETEEGNEEFGLQDLTNIQIRNVGETKSRKLRKIKKKSNGKTRRNKKARKGQKSKGKTVNKTEKNKKRQDKKFGGKNSKQNSCQSSSEVDAACIQNAIDILGYERNQILNFQKQKARIESHNRTANNKRKKRDSFQAAASALLESIGGNLNSPTCKDSTSSRMAATAVDNYNTLANCSSTISEACSVPSTTFNTTILTNL